MALADNAARRRALTDLGSTLLVEAAAGTGKTALIAGRVAMLLACGAEPRSIAAITFTELAASALAARVHRYVHELPRRRCAQAAAGGSAARRADREVSATPWRQVRRSSTS